MSHDAAPSSALPSCDSTTQTRRGATHPVFLHYTSFYQLSVHRTCNRREDTDKGETRRADGRNAPEGERHYALLVRMEVTRRRQRQRPQQPDGHEEAWATTSMRRRFSTALLDAAYHSVVNASSRRNSTNEAQFLRLRACAIQKQEALHSAETCKASMNDARREGDQKEAMLVSFTDTQDADTTMEAEAEEVVVPSVEQQPMTLQQQTDLSTFLRMLGDCTAVPSIQEKPHTEVSPHRTIRRHNARITVADFLCWFCRALLTAE